MGARVGRSRGRSGGRGEAIRLFAAAGLLLPVAVACAPDCVDDGFFAQQQKPGCVAATATTTTTTESTSSGTTTTTSTTMMTTTTSTTTGVETTSTTAVDPTTTTTSTTSTTDPTTTTGGESCDDALQNQDESDIDCGGVCPGCADGQGCSDDDDCASAVCGPLDACVPASCSDGVFTPGMELHIDCGGVCGPTCGPSKPCASDDDCAAGLSCLGPADYLRCVTDPLCVNFQVDPGETDLDCGGICGPTCPAFFGCNDDSDCGTLMCVEACDDAPCSNQVQDGDESDVDCGGFCDPCGPDDACYSNLDCSPPFLCTGGACVFP